jgi:hypothetical protein
MTVTIELSAEMEHALNALAEMRGVALPEVIRGLLESQLSKTGSRTSAEERAKGWRASTKGLPSGPPLSDEAISRENIYGSRP